MRFAMIFFLLPFFLKESFAQNQNFLQKEWNTSFTSPTNIVAFANTDNYSYFLAGGKIYFSDNDGVNWEKLSTIREGIVVFAAEKSNILYCNTLGEVYFSNNHGMSWQKSPISLSIDQTNNANISIVSAKISNGDLVIAYNSGSNGNVVYSNNRGASWERVLTLTSRVLDLAVFDNTLWLASNGMWKSSNKGKTWAKIGNTSYTSLFPVNSNILYGESQSISGCSISRSADGGMQWSSSVLREGCLGYIAVKGQMIFISTTSSKGGIFRSTNDATTWKKIAEPQDILNAGLITITAKGTLLTGTKAGLFRSGDDGDNWSIIGGNPTISSFSSVFMKGKNGLASIRSLGGFIATSIDSGKIWQVDPKTFDFQPRATLITTDEKFLISNGENVYYKEKLDTNWQVIDTLNIRNTGGVINLQEDADSNLFAVGTLPGRIWRSSNKGLTWKAVLTPNSQVRKLIIQQNQMFALVGGSKIFYSNDKGNTWTLIIDYPEAPELQTIAFVQNTIWAANANGSIFKSSIQEKKLQLVANNLTQSLPIEADYLTDLFAVGDYLFIGFNRNGVYVSISDGRTWEPFNNGILLSPFITLNINFVRNNNLLFAVPATRRDGLPLLYYVRLPLENAEVSNNNISPLLTLTITPDQNSLTPRRGGESQTFTFNVNSRGTNVTDATVNIQDPFTSQTRTVQTSAQGTVSYTLTVPANATSGTYTLRFTASKTGFTASTTLTRTVQVIGQTQPPEPSLARHQLLVTPERKRTLKFFQLFQYQIRVLDSLGNPVSNRNVQVVYKPIAITTFATTNAEGICNVGAIGAILPLHERNSIELSLPQTTAAAASPVVERVYEVYRQLPERTQIGVIPESQIERNQSREITTRLRGSDLAQTVFSVTSSNVSLLPLTNISITRNGEVLALALRPTANQMGEAIITISADDMMEPATTQSFKVKVVPEADPKKVWVYRLTTSGTVSSFFQKELFRFEISSTSTAEWSGGGRNTIEANNADISINDFLKFSGDMKIDTLGRVVTYSGELYIERVEQPGEIGIFKKYLIQKGTNLVFDFDRNTSKMTIVKPGTVPLLAGRAFNLKKFEFFTGLTTVGIRLGGEIDISYGLNCQDPSKPLKFVIDSVEISYSPFDNRPEVRINSGIENVGLWRGGCLDFVRVGYNSRVDTLGIKGQISFPFLDNKSTSANRTVIGASVGLEKGNFNNFTFYGETPEGFPLFGNPACRLYGINGKIEGWSVPPLKVGLGGSLSFKSRSWLELDIRGEWQGDGTDGNRFKLDASARFWKLQTGDWAAKGNAKMDWDYGEQTVEIGLEDVKLFPFTAVDRKTSQSKKFHIVDAPRLDAKYTYKAGSKEHLYSTLKATITIPPIPTSNDSWFGSATAIKWISDNINKSLGLPLEVASVNCTVANSIVQGSMVIANLGEIRFSFNMTTNTTTFDIGSSAPFGSKINLASSNTKATVLNNNRQKPLNDIETANSGLTKIKALPEMEFSADDQTARIIIAIHSKENPPVSSLIAPSRVEIKATTRDSSVIYSGRIGSDIAFWTIYNPERGVWKLNIPNSTAEDSVEIFEMRKDPPFSIQAISSNRTAKITWNGNVSSSNDSVDVFFDDDNSGFNGFYAGTAAANTGEFTYLLTDSLARCQYFAYGIRRQNNAIATAYSSSPIVNPKSLQIPQNLTVRQVNRDTLGITWQTSASSNITGYNLYVSDDNGKDSLILRVGSNVNNAMPRIAGNKWKILAVRSVDNNNLESCSSSIAIPNTAIVNQGTAAPTGFRLLTPPNNAGNISPASITFRWASAPSSVYYNFQISTDPSFIHTLRNEYFTDTTQTFTGFNLNRWYYWRVRPLGGDWSPVWSFYTGTLPTQTTPFGNATVQNASAQLSSQMPSSILRAYQPNAGEYLNILSLRQYPNPFSSTTTLEYLLPREAHVRMDVCNMLGQTLITPVNGTESAGAHLVDVTMDTFPSGVYVVRLSVGGQVLTRQMTLIR